MRLRPWMLTALAAAVAAPASAYDVVTMYPGCQQQRTWCERAAAMSYGDQARFRNALTAVVAAEWVRVVEAAQKVASGEGYPVHSPSAVEITADLINAWRIGSSCCDVALKAPIEAARAAAPDYGGYCMSAADGSAASRRQAERCVDAVRLASPPR